MLPIAVDQSAYPQLAHCHREQAPSHLFTVLCQYKLPAVATAAGKANTFNSRHTADQSVGGGLLPIAVDQSAYPQLAHRHRKQAPHLFTVPCQDKLPAVATAAGKANTFNNRHTADQSVGGGLLPIAVDQSAYPHLAHRHREQAPSHTHSAATLSHCYQI